MPTLPSRADAVVIGAGFAGLAAGVRLAQAGRKVVVLEEAPRLGGRASAFTDRETGERLDNGQHVLFGCYRETYSFLRRIGADTDAPLQPRLSLPIASSGGRLFPLTCPDLTPPWHLLAGVIRWRALGTRDRWSALRIGGLVRDARRLGAEAVAAQVPSGWTVNDWLRDRKQSRHLCQWLWHPLAILVSTAVASYVWATTPDPGSTLAWLKNPGPHGFSEMLYEFTSSAANNGSGFEGLGDNTPFWNISCGLVMLLSRYIPIIAPLALAGSLAAKPAAPDTAGSLRADSGTFGFTLWAVIVILGLLMFMPVAVLGPIAEHLALG